MNDEGTTNRQSPAMPATAFRGAFDASPSTMAILDNNGAIVAVNHQWRAFARDNAGQEDGYLGRNYLDMIPGDGDETSRLSRDAIQSLLDGSATNAEFEYPCHSPEKKRWYMMRAVRFEEDGNAFILVIHTDITDRRLAEDAARQAAARDPLTGLTNRRSFEERAEQVLAMARRQKSTAALMFMDLDNFKPINDQHGHGVGDQVLTAIAQRFSQTLRETDIPARFGGDEFIAFCLMDGTDHAPVILGRLVEQLSLPVEVDGNSINVGYSIGVAFFPGHGQSIADLVAAADQAMYKAKSGKGPKVCFASSPASSA